MRSAVLTALAFVTAFAATTGVPACQGPCFNAFDCGPGAYCQDNACHTDCAADADCPAPTCDAMLETCARRFATCDDLGRCQYGGIGRRTPGLPAVVEGWDDPPATGDTFVVNALAIGDEGQGFNLDGSCRSGQSDCIDNTLAPLAQLANTQIQQGVIAGESLLLLELAGLSRPFNGSARSATLKLYSARDADSPPLAANNFSPQGSEACCEFVARGQSLNAPGKQALSRAPATIYRGKISLLAPTSLEVLLAIGNPPYRYLGLERALITGDVSTSLDRIDNGLIGAAIPARSLALMSNPFCHTLSGLCPRTFNTTSSLLDLVVGYFQPDIDLNIPRDGLDHLSLGPTGVVEDCRDGRGRRVPPEDPTRPGSCAESNALRDGFSVTLTFSAVAARIVGVGN